MQSRRPKPVKVGDKKHSSSPKSSPKFKKETEGNDTFSYMRKTNEKVIGSRKGPSKRHEDSSFKNAFGKKSGDILNRGNQKDSRDDSPRNYGDRNENKFGKPYSPKGGSKTSSTKSWGRGAPDFKSNRNFDQPLFEKKPWEGKESPDAKPWEKGRANKPTDKPTPNRSSSVVQRTFTSKPTSKKKQSLPSDESLGIRLNRFISNSGVCARREADKLIEAGEIYVNGKVMTDFSYRVQETDTVKYGSKILKREKYVYVLLNKPKDFLTTTEDPENRKTVMDLVRSASTARLYPVGRLDRNTTGLLLMTNDGDLAEKLMHPSFLTKKIYQVDLDRPFSDTDLQKVRNGIMLEDGPIKPDDIEIVSPDRKSVGIEIHSGRNRIVRRIFEHLEYHINRLDRVMYAGLTKKDLPRGTWRFLTELEVTTLKHIQK